MKIQSIIPLEQIKILVVEDNPLVQFAVTSMLDDLGYGFDLAGDGAAAIECARKTNDYSLVFMDIDLPDMTGIEVTKVLLSLENTKDVPIVAMTSHTAPEYIERCFAAAMVGYYNKPTTNEDIKNIIRHHVVKTVETVVA